MSACLPADLRGGQLDAARWAQWLKTADVQVRHRLDAGEEDTLTNLLRFGVTFTKEYRIDDEYFARYGESTLVDSFAEPFRIDRGRHVPGERRARPCPLVVPAGESVARFPTRKTPRDCCLGSADLWRQLAALYSGGGPERRTPIELLRT
jgi:hypothetical protein